MNIQSLVYEDLSADWQFELIEFKPLTMLVGASGVGKTQVLKAILNLKNISHGKSLNGVKWEVQLTTVKGYQYKWCGCFQNKGNIPEVMFKIFGEENEQDLPCIEYEQLFIDGELIIDRNSEDISFNNKTTVKLSRQKSVIFLLKEETQIQDLNAEFNRVIFDNNANANSMLAEYGFLDETDSKLNQYINLDTIRNSNEKIRSKLYFTYKNQPAVFNEIANAFVDVFPYIEKIKIEPLTNEHKTLPLFMREEPFIQIKEKGVAHWVDELKISSGMLRTLMHLSELHLCADGTVILIDEFENSLGINCIDELTSSIVSSERGLQFIITSHHPYIINNIAPSHWKIVTRKAGVVKAQDAEKFNIGKSKHTAFTQLINLDAYSEGVGI